VLLAATCLLASCGGGGAVTGTAPVTLAAAPTPTPSPTPSPTPTPAAATTSTVTVEYDASVGLGVDAAGFANLPLRSGAKRFFVSSSSGNDANGCGSATAPATPLRTLAAAAACITRGAGDQVLVAEGSVLSVGLPTLHYKGGFSAAYPTVIQSYDPADPLNEARYGRATSNRPNVMSAGGNNQPAFADDGDSYFAIRGLAFGPASDSPDNGVAWTGSDSYVLFENNVFRYTGIGFNPALTTSHLVFRHNAVLAPWSPSANAQCLFVAHNSSVTIEDSVFHHCGWKIGASRGDTVTNGGPTALRHAIYTTTSTSATVRRNLMIAPSATGCSCRGDIVGYDNLVIRAPVALAGGSGDNYNVERPTGVDISFYNNTVIGGDDITIGGGPKKWAIVSENGRAGSSAHHNLIVRSGDTTYGNAFRTSARLNAPSYMLWDANRVIGWGSMGSLVFIQEVDAYAATQIHATYTNNYWDLASSGTNLNNTGLPSGYAYADALAAAMGSTDVAGLGMDAIAKPELDWALKGQGLAGAAFAMSWAP